MKLLAKKLMPLVLDDYLLFLLSIVSIISAPVPIMVTGNPVSDSILPTNSLAFAGNFEKSVTPLDSGKTMSNFVNATCVALLIRIAFFAKS